MIYRSILLISSIIIVSSCKDEIITKTKNFKFKIPNLTTAKLMKFHSVLILTI